MPPAPAPAPESELAARLAYLQRVLPLDQLEGRGSDAASVERYYSASNWAYRRFHSPEGAIHFSLNPSPHQFDPQGYARHAELVEQRLPPNASRVLELAFGNGYNIEQLLERQPQLRISGIDLTAKHVQLAAKRLGHHPQVRVKPGDFHRITYPARSFDAVYVVEALCHAQDMSQALREAYRVLVPGGRLIVIDGWRADNLEQMSAQAQQAVRLAEWAMALGEGTVGPTQWWQLAQQAGFEPLEEVDLTAQILPSLLRVERLSWRFLRRPRLVAVANRVAPLAVQNAVAGFLLHASARSGGFSYRMMVAQR